jgi:hypothetical protein
MFFKTSTLEDDTYKILNAIWVKERIGLMSITAKGTHEIDVALRPIIKDLKGKDIFLFETFVDLQMQLLRVQSIIESYRIAISMLAKLPKAEKLSQKSMLNLARRLDELIEKDCYAEFCEVNKEIEDLIDRGQNIVIKSIEDKEP